MNRAGALEEIDKAASIADYTKVIELDPKNAAAFGRRGVMRLYLKQKAEAAVDLQKAISLDPSMRADYEPQLKEALKK